MKNLSLLVLAILAIAVAIVAGKGNDRRYRLGRRNRHNRPHYRRYFRHRHHRRHHDDDDDDDDDTKYIYYPYPVYPYGTTYYTNPNYYYWNGQWYYRRTARHATNESHNASSSKIPAGAQTALPAKAQKPLDRFACAKRGVALDPRHEFKTQWGVCSKNWVYCSAPDAEPELMSCPADLRFDSENEQCLSQLDIFACSGQRKQEKGEVVSRDDEQANETTTVRQPTPAADGFCDYPREDGYYPLNENECSSEYVACSGEAGMLLSCPKGEAWFDEEQRCEFFDQLPECGGERPASVDERAFDGLNNESSSTKEPLFVCSRAGVIPDPEESMNTEWGVCSQAWYYCPATDMLPELMRCPSGLYYDLESELCVGKSHVYACTGRQQNNTSSAQPKSKEIKDEKWVQQYCADKDDGNYEYDGDCSQYFVICKANSGYLINCPGLSRYSLKKNSCVTVNECL